MDMEMDVKEMDAECALHILTKAEQIKQNSDLMGKVKELAKTQAPIIKSIADIKAKYNKMVEEDDAKEDSQDPKDAKGEEETDHTGTPIKEEPKMSVFKPETYDAKTYKQAEV